MNTANHCCLEGIVTSECWTRYSPRKRGQVRFWLVVGDDVLLCAVEPLAIVDVPVLETEIYAGRRLKIKAAAHRVDLANPFAERMAVVIFVAESCEFLDSQASHELTAAGPVNITAAAPRRHAAHGKMAAAGDDSQLPLEGSLS